MKNDRSKRSRTAPALAALALALPRAAAACPMCMSGTDERVQTAFALGSLALSVLPLAMIGGGVWWLVRRARRIEAQEAQGVIRLPSPRRRDEAPGGPSSGPRRAA